MMERRRVLTIPFCVEKDHQSETPLKIPINCLSPECRKLEGQIPWTAFADCKNISHNSQHKNGSVIFDRSPAAVITVEMTRKKPILVLTDVLKTDLGKDYIERVKMSGTICLRGRPKDPRKERDRCREEPQTCRNTRSTQREANNNIGSESLTPKRDLKTTSTVFQRKRLKRKLQNDEDEHKEESQDTEEMMRGKDSKKEERLEVLDCELSTATSCDAFPSDDIKGRFTSPKKHEQQKRKKKIFGSQCNGTSGCKRHCESFLHLSVEDGKEGGQVSSSEEENHGKQSPRSVNMEDSEYNVDLENMDRCILQFTVGGDDGTEALVPVINPLLEAEDNINIPRQKSSSRQDSMTQTCPSEPIVLSSDDEEGSGSSQCSREATQTVAETVRQRKSSQEAVSKQEEVSDTQMMELLVEASPPSSPASPVPEVDYSCLSVPFSVLHCGGYQARASGGLMIAEHKIIIPLEDTSTQERILSFERKELRKYSIWDQQELEEWGFHINGEGASPCVLLFYVSETAAAAIQQDLCQLCVKEEESINTEKASPFILLTLKDPLDGMEGALLRSMLDIDCINSMTLKQTLSAQDDRIDFSSPVLSLDNCVELIRRTGLDSHLLSMLSMRSTSSEQRTDQDSSNYDEDEIPTAHIWLDADFQNEPDQDQDHDHNTAPSEDTETEIKLKEDPKEEKQENSSDNKKEEAQSVYTVCHRRTKGSYSVSLSKPDSKWIKYKHRGVARRLIQFPPPPLKGGITVTMENLQCLDSGQYLNDVIIDFYLKYLIQNVPAALAERCHIFSSFFYKQLTRRDNASEGGNSDSCQRQRRHQRVKTWTRHVDIFEKDFLFVPVNQEAHWYLVVICFPGLEEMKLEDWTGDTEDQDEAPGCKSSKDNTETPVPLKWSDSPDPETEKNREESTKDSTPCPVSCTEQTCQKKTVCKRPCILIMDSLKVSLHERVFKLLREYLQSEWEARRGSSRDFGPDQMKSSHCKVPLQDNSSDCGLYLLQYVECFLKDPVVHFDLPLLLQKWFPRQVIRKKRDEIRDLILNLYRHQNLENE